jgi:hypothetical protein
MGDHAIPTRYNGVQFRSRLEARWAAFFDLCKWQWEYEPFDLKGYIPDFILKFKKPLLIEVKPLLWDGSTEERDTLQQAQRKIEASGWNKEALIVGATVQPGDPFDNRLGELCEVSPRVDHNDTTVGIYRTWDTAFYFYCTNCKRDSFANLSQTWECRVSGCYDGDHYIGEAWNAVALFREAGNRVQWNAPKPATVKTGRKRHVRRTTNSIGRRPLFAARALQPGKTIAECPLREDLDETSVPPESGYHYEPDDFMDPNEYTPEMEYRAIANAPTPLSDAEAEFFREALAAAGDEDLCEPDLRVPAPKK